MKVFISSTCYDLIDLRAEILEDLRRAGVDVHLSDLKGSDFEVSIAPDVNSIEACLINVRRCDLIIFVLSQRYGPSLGKAFGHISAMHLEYKEALKEEKQILFYVRDRLHADYCSWKRNSKRDDFKPVWAKAGDQKMLFAFIDEHQTLVGAGGSTHRNNWFILFATSLDLRQDIGRRLTPYAYEALARKRIETEQVPILVVAEQSVQRINGDTSKLTFFTFTISNMGQAPAIDVSGTLELGHRYEFQGAGSSLGAISSHSSTDGMQSRKIRFDLPDSFLGKSLKNSPPTDGLFFWHLRMDYSVPCGHIMIDMTDRCRLPLLLKDDQLTFASACSYVEKRLVGIRNFVAGDRFTSFFQAWPELRVLVANAESQSDSIGGPPGSRP